MRIKLKVVINLVQGHSEFQGAEMYFNLVCTAVQITSFQSSFAIIVIDTVVLWLILATQMCVFSK
jgi:hypothetical protein